MTRYSWDNMSNNMEADSCGATNPLNPELDTDPGTGSKCSCGFIDVGCIVIDDNDPCTLDICDPITGETSHPPAPAGTACGDPADTDCDNPDTCDGSGVCQDNFESSTTECRASGGVCDVAESCDGQTNACPDDAKASATTECRASGGVCDVAESCDGQTNACPDDAKASATTECRASGGVCDVAESCDGQTNACPDDAKASATTECRASGGVCDVAESCDGQTNACPDDAKASATTECRASGGICDVAESCDGQTNACPDDAKASATTECRASGGICDVAESCDGQTNACPDDAKVSATTECRADGGVCDVAESCDGQTNDCPADAKVSATTECRADGGVCDVAESCDGQTNDCPADAKVSATTECRADGGECDVMESCDGISNDCPPDGFEPPGTECGDDTDNTCTDPDTCDGDGACLPNNEPCSSVTDSALCVFDVSTKGVCVDGTGDPVVPAEACDSADTCDGSTCAITGADCSGDPSACQDSCLVGTCLPENQFKLIYTPDGKNWPAYKLNASNPGQTFYNLFYNGDPTVLTISIPYPYVTVGGTPVHVYDGADVGNILGDDCFEPPVDTLEGGDVGTQLTIDDWIAGGTNPSNVTCDPVCGPDGVGFCTFTVDLTTMEDPDSNQYYVNVHLDYGLKGVHLDANPCDDLADADRYDVDTLSMWGQADANGWTGQVLLSGDAYVDDTAGDYTALDVVGLSDCRDHVFSHDESGDLMADFSDNVQNLNVFKGIAGAFGALRSSLTGDSYEGHILTLAKASNPTAILKTTASDEDGAYLLFYKHKGKPAMYIIDLYDPSGSELIGTIDFELQGNGWTQIDFDPDGDPCNIDSAFCACNGWCASAEYGSGRRSGGGGKKSKR